VAGLGSNSHAAASVSATTAASGASSRVLWAIEPSAEALGKPFVDLYGAWK
jgi:hypothetical protein